MAESSEISWVDFDVQLLDWVPESVAWMRQLLRRKPMGSRLAFCRVGAARRAPAHVRGLLAWTDTLEREGRSLRARARTPAAGVLRITG